MDEKRIEEPKNEKVEALRLVLEVFAMHLYSLKEQGLDASHLTVPKFLKNNKDLRLRCQRHMYTREIILIRMRSFRRGI